MKINLIKCLNSLKNLAPFMVIIIFFFTLLYYSNYQPDPVVDFGRELYVPWRITQGDVLYQDIAYFNGPLVPYINAAIFAVFGVGTLSLFACSMVLSLGLLLALWYVIKSVFDKKTAFIVSVNFLLMTVFANFTQISNYNFITPYSYEMFYGLILSFGFIVLVCCYERLNFKLFLNLSAIIFGLIILTKYEFVLACGLTALFALLLSRYRISRMVLINDLIFFVFVSGTTVAIALLIFRVILGDYFIFSDLLLGFRSVFNPEIRSLPYYLWVSGFDNMSGNVLHQVLGLVWIVCPFAFAFMLNVEKHDLFGKFEWTLFWKYFFITVFFIVWITFFPIHTYNIGYSFAIVDIIVLIYFLKRYFKTQNTRDFYLLVFALFSLLLLSKIILKPIIYHYGFVLALPSASLLMCVMMFELPRLFERYERDGKSVVYVSMFIILVCFLNMFDSTLRANKSKDYQLESVNASFQITSDQSFIQNIIAYLDSKSKTSTLTVFPEGVMLNYMTGLKGSTRYISFMPPEVIMYGESRVYAEFESHPSDYVVVLDRDLSGYGFRNFGHGYLDELQKFINNNYHKARDVIIKYKDGNIFKRGEIYKKN